MLEIFIFPLVFLIFFSIPILSLILALWVAYDSITKRPGMEPLEKIIWILLSFLIPIIVPILYYLIVLKEEKTIIKEQKPKEEEILSTIEKLHELKKEGAITEQEYLEKKKQLLQKTRTTETETKEKNNKKV